VPPEGQILVQWPLEFVVGIEIDDPTHQYAARVFIDPDDTSSPALDLTIDPGRQPLVAAGILSLSFEPPAPDPTFCHVVELLVARAFVGTTGPAAHTPDPYGADRATWYYNPGGDPNGCPEYDAGTDGSALDAPPDGLPIPIPPGSGGDP
jgi:hypothetical protein